MSLLRRLVELLRRPTLDAAPPTSPPPPPLAAQPASPPQPPRLDPHLIIRQIAKETPRPRGALSANLSKSAAWRSLKARPADIQVAVLVAALGLYRARPDYDWRKRQFYASMLTSLLRRNLPLTERQLADLLAAWNAQSSLEGGLPGLTILGAVERYAEETELTGRLKDLVERIQKRAARGPYFHAHTKAWRVIALRAGQLLDPSATAALPSGTFGKQIKAHLASLPPERRALWAKLVALAAEGGIKAKPTRKWLQAVQVVMVALDHRELTREVLDLLDATTPDPARPDPGLDILQGLVWASVHLNHGDVVGALGRFADRCFRKVRNVGARSVSLGNAALWALSQMADEPRAAAELFRLRERIKYASTRKGIDARLGDLAQRTGRTVTDLEDLSLPDLGLSEGGVATRRIGGARVNLTVAAHAIQVQWFNSDGKLVKSVPAEVRNDHAAALADLRRRVKDIEEARASQALRLEQSWIEARDWSFADWSERYLRHPLRGTIVQALIWRVGSWTLMVAGDRLVDLKGRTPEIEADARVRLWHPLDTMPEEVLAWRRRIQEVGVTQPIKQAHREIYVLTDAERQTGVYSNRFAAHILRQHQFRALCQARGWRYDLMGAWDGYNTPIRPLPMHGLSVEYQVEVLDDGGTSASGVALHLTTDQVRFVDERDQSVELDQVPPIVFSEALRDVDLFVAVTSVANDPGWADGGPEGRNAGYWREWAFGALGQSAQTRRELIAWIAPKLSIADKLEVTDKFLIVAGRRQRYAIHFGSGNIQTRPGNRYLCIVPDRSPSEAAGVKLPFTGDGVLSTILAKAFLLVDEDKITDRTIRSQL